MNYIFIKKIWKDVRRKISAVLIISILLTSISPSMATYAQNTNYKFVDELEVDESLIDDDMFYMPYASLTTTEGDENNKYVFKVKRKGEELKEENVRLTMVDITGKYDRDYSIKVIDKASFSENVKNKLVSKSLNELLNNTDYEEYNYSDAIIDGSLFTDNTETETSLSSDLSEETVSAFTNTDDEIKSSNAKDTNNVESTTQVETKDETTLANKIEDENETTTTTKPEDESETTTIETETNDENEKAEVVIQDETTTTTRIENEDETETETITETTTISTEVKDENDKAIVETNDENETTIATQIKDENKKESETTLIATDDETTTIASIENIDKEENATIEKSSDTITNIDNNVVATATNIEKEDKELLDLTTVSEKKNVATESLVLYGNEEVQFEIKKSTMSMADGFKIATGLDDDKKIIKPDRKASSILPSKNSLEDSAYMQNSIEAIEEELKSAYVILEFKEGQEEKLIELSINNDKKYRGDRQVGFNLSGVDGSQIAGMYSSLTLLISDDEEEEPSYINFTKAEYTPHDGYISVDIERSGSVSDIATCMIDTEDITAISGRDYSKVHAELLFGFGINKRNVKIPITSDYIKANSTFKLKLQEAKGALIGENATAICKIRLSDKSFKYANEKLNKIKSKNSSEQLFGSEGNNLNKQDKKSSIQSNVLNNNSNLFGAGGEDYDLDSVITGEALNIEKDVYDFTSKKANKHSEHYFKNDGKGMHMYIENHSVSGETATFKWGVNAMEDGKMRYDVSGMQIEWSVENDNADITIKEKNGNADEWNKLYDKNRRNWDTRKDNFFFNYPAFTYLWFNINRYDGMWRHSPTIDIEAIRPILRMFKINMILTDVPALVNNRGELTRDHKWVDYARLSIDGAKSDRTAVGWSGKTITVKLDYNQNNPFYIKTLYMVSEDGSTKREIARNTDVNATTISFKIDTDLINNNWDLIKRIDRPSGSGKNGEFYLYAELDTKPAEIKIVKDKRVDVKIWNKNPDSSTTDTNNYTYRIGDVLHFNVTISKEYQDLFRCDGLNVYRVQPYSPEWITIRRPTDDSDYFPLDSEYSEIRIEPLVSQKNNMVIVRVKKDKISLFDDTYGLFKNTKYETNDYVDYYIETDGSKVCGKYFDIKARCKDEENVPVWYEINKEQVKYIQNEYYFLGKDTTDDNVIYLTAEKGDDIEYSIVGTAYYEEVPIGGKVVDKYWQEAPFVGVLVDDTHFAYTDTKGVFATIPAKGKKGYYNILKIVSNGTDKYISVTLNQDKKTKRTYVVDYETGTKTITKDVYEIETEEVIISNMNTIHPHITGVKSLSMAQSLLSAVYINDKPSILEASVVTKKEDGSDYTYTYIDADGVERTASENVKRVEFIVMDAKSHSIKKVIEATRSNADKTLFTAAYTFERGHYAEYMSGDKLYVRIVTDRKIGDGKGIDIGGDTREDIPIFNETTYQSISTIIPFIEEAEKEPYIVNINFLEDETSVSANGDGNGNTNGSNYSLPIIGYLSTFINAQGMAFRTVVDGDRVRLYLGKRLQGKGNRYDGNGNMVSDVGYAIDSSNVAEGMSDMTDLIKESGTHRLGTMTLGIPTWSITPIIGVYFEFVLVSDPSSIIKSRYKFSGGGGYLGGVLDLRYTFYFLVYAVPCYIGGEVNLTLVGEFGAAVKESTDVELDDPTQSLIDKIIDNTRFEYLFRANMITTAYAGVGIAGTVGIRGGINLVMMFIYNPFIKQVYKNVRPVGFSVTGNITFWVEAVFLKIPIPVYHWKKPYDLGYFEDIKNVQPINYNSSDDSVTYDSFDKELEIAPRFGGNSKFVANSSDINKNLFGGTYEEEGSRTLISDSYDRSEPKLMKFADDKVLLVYLDDESSRGDLDRTALKYMIYDATLNTWSSPQNIWECNNTADFSPNLCDCNDKILLSWVSRPNEVSNDVDKKELLSNMEVYTVFFDKATGSFENIERMTTDTAYDYYPNATYDKMNDRIYLYYLKKQNVADIENADDLLNEVQTEVNGAYLMYMLYGDAKDGLGKRWLRDYYYDYEIANATTDDEREEFINTWRGQRFKDFSINIGGDTPVINNPSIRDYVVSNAKIFDTSSMQNEINLVRSIVLPVIDVPASSNVDINNRFAAFADAHADKNKLYDIVSYVVESDGDINTKEDTEIYLKLHAATESEAKTIRLTHNDVSDLMPKIVQNDKGTYLFWVQNESMIKMLELNQLIGKAYDEHHESNEITSGEINIMTTDKLILSDKINNIAPFIDEDNNIYVAWQQNSNQNIDVDNIDDLDFKQDLYVAGLIESENSDGEKVQSWSNPVRFTNNGKLNDLPTVADIGNKLLLVNNQYNLKSNDDSYEITNSNLEAITYAPKSSLTISKVDVNVDRVNTDGSIRYKLVSRINNTGLYTAKGFDYTGNITYDDTILTVLSGGSDEYVLAGNETIIGGNTIADGTSYSTPEIYFTLTEEQRHHIDKVKIKLNIIERNVGDSGVESEINIFDAEERFNFVLQNSNEINNDYNGNLKVSQEGDEFVLKGILNNSGDIDTLGNERIYVIDQDNWDEPVAISDYIDLPLNGQMQFSIPLNKDILSDSKNGIKDLVVCVKNDEGKKLSDYEIATINVRSPYNFKVNGKEDKIVIRVGDKITLNTTYEPSERYKNATILYSVADGQIAKSEGNSLYGLKEGNTKLRLTTKEFGGTKEIDVVVNKKIIPPVPPSDGGSTNGGGGGSGVGPISYNASITKLDAVATNMTNVESKDAKWIYDPINDSWKLNVNIEGLGVVEAKNSFYAIKQNRTTIINGNEIITTVNDVYCFDANGKMLTGWVKTNDGKWYFFEDARSNDVGKMIYGWRNVQGYWYYFNSDGVMLVNTITPDGFIVDSEGKWVK